ncbi:YjbH domain-containing protein [Falsihalocynthiibacter sp. S25ZX9]|uniref:YjbH domain-containing protein n=2 Tax=Roseobacteraceae TaxID=2854170 RepID=UPI00350EA78B
MNNTRRVGFMLGHKRNKVSYRGLALRSTAPSLCIASLVLAVPTAASDASYNLAGIAGLIDMPSGEAMPDAELAVTMSTFAGGTRASSTFQITKRLSGTFRYSRIDNWNTIEYPTYYDRSFDLRYQFLTETEYLPAVTVGIMDVAGTGIYSAEYIAATKNFSPKIRATIGLGWGRLGSYNSIGSPFGTRPPIDVGQGGTFSTNQYFRGPMSVFGGVEYRPTEKLSLKVEYSSDDYTLEAGEKDLFDRKSPLNFGAEYRFNDIISAGVYYMYGSELAASLSMKFSPKRPAVLGSYGPAPLAVQPRPVYADDPEQYSTIWMTEPGSQEILAQNLQKHMEFDDVKMEAVAMRGTSVEVRIRNETFINSAQAIGRTARALTRTMPPSVETFEIVNMVNGLATSVVKLKRSDVEKYSTAPNGEALIMASAVIEDIVPTKPANLIYAPGVYPDFQWAIDPYMDFSLFDPDDPIRWGAGIEATTLQFLAPGLELSGSIQAQLIGTLGKDESPSTSAIQPVRSDANLYESFSPVSLQYLTLGYFFQPTEEIYGRVSAGYLERMFGGISSELLWMPVNQPFAFGIEANYVVQRETDSYLGFQDYGVATGHASVYYKHEASGFDFQLSAGKYLAGDVGGTFTVRREFTNGWRVGAFATLTDLSAEDYGEGSFDKGVILEIPQSWLTGKPSRRVQEVALQVLSRDGGAQLIVNDRLYDRIRVNHAAAIRDGQGRVWR